MGVLASPVDTGQRRAACMCAFFLTAVTGLKKLMTNDTLLCAVVGVTPAPGVRQCRARVATE